MFEVMVLGVEMWFTPTADGELVRVGIRHEEPVCCFELRVHPDVALNWSYECFGPWDAFGDLCYTIYPHEGHACFGHGLSVGARSPGEMNGPFDGLAGEFVGSGELVLGLNESCESVKHWGGAPGVVYSGSTPNTLMPVEWYWTEPGDFNGDGVVGVTDFTCLLGQWGIPYGTTDLLDMLTAWD